MKSVYENYAIFCPTKLYTVTHYRQQHISGLFAFSAIFPRTFPTNITDDPTPLRWSCCRQSMSWELLFLEADGFL